MPTRQGSVVDTMIRASAAPSESVREAPSATCRLLMIPPDGSNGRLGQTCRHRPRWA